MYVQTTRETSSVLLLFNTALIERSMKLTSNHMEIPRRTKLHSSEQNPALKNSSKPSVAKDKRPFKVLKEVKNLQGGVMQAKLSCDLPHDRRQIYDFKSANKVKLQTQSMTSGIPRSDTLAHVMSQCKEMLSGSDAFIRSVEAAPEPMCVLATY